MTFLFRLEHQLGLMTGTLTQVFSSSGIPLSMVRDASTGQIVAHAVGIVSEPFLALPQLILGGVQMAQTHMGFQKTYQILDALQTSIGVLQATTAVIGVGVGTNVLLSAVNLYETQKLRKAVERLELKIENGFIDMKQALKNLGTDIIQQIDEVAQDIKFEPHRVALIKAYGEFMEAIKLIKTAMVCEDISIRNITLGNAQLMLSNALAAYDNRHLLAETSAAGYLRRAECAWVMEQTIAFTYNLQNQPAATSLRLNHLVDKIRTDTLIVADRCQSEQELDFLFPEISRIHGQDVPLLESWRHHVDWSRNLSAKELQMLNSAELNSEEVSTRIEPTQEVIVSPEHLEQSIYENLKQKSHYQSLLEQLKFLIKSDLRLDKEAYITQQAIAKGYSALATSNWQSISNLTVANLYWYFRNKDKTQTA